MANFNRVILIGNVTRDIQLSYLPSQTPVADFGIAVNERWTDKSTGEKKEKANFFDCKCFGKQAETLQKYVSKGSPLMVEGSLDHETWEANGAKHSRVRIKVSNFQFLGQAKSGDSQPTSAAPSVDYPDDDGIPY